MAPLRKKALGIFAKEPVAGRVKTRLCPPLSPAQAASLYETSLRETLGAMAGGDFDLVLFYAGDVGWFRKAFAGLRLLPQRGDDLGERMAAALRQLQADYERTALIGSDSPDLPRSLVAEAFLALGRADAVIAPASDGGYVLVGERRHHPELFRDIPWSSPAVLHVTRRRIAEHGIVCRELAPWEDVDDLPSLRRLMRRSPDSATVALARQLLERTGR